MKAFWPLVFGSLLLALTIGVGADYGFPRFHPQAQTQDLTGGWSGYRLRAICDTGNGTMVYVAVGMSGTTAVALQPGGCAKVHITAEKGE